mgnify:CR=1 FL=1
MIDLQDKNHPPILEEIGEYIRNPLFHEFCLELRETFQCREKIEFSSCSWERGWNIKFKKSGKTLCTIYPRETYFTAMLAVGKKEKEPFEAMLSECSKELGEIYRQTKEGNGQKWLMLDLQDKGGLYRDALRLAALRAAK